MVPILIFGAVLLGLFVRYVQLRVYLNRSDAAWASCRARVMALGQELARYAFSHQGMLPDNLDRLLRLLPKGECGYVYRYVPELGLDKRLILAYDDAPRHALMLFPRLAQGRHVLFADGKVDLFAEEAVHQLVVGDNVLRERLNLPEIPFMEVRDGGV